MTPKKLYHLLVCQTPWRVSIHKSLHKGVKWPIVIPKWGLTWDQNENWVGTNWVEK